MIVLLAGTRKGLFLAESDARRETWKIRGPLISGTWAMHYVGFDVRYSNSNGGHATIYAGGASNWYGPAIWRSDDLGLNWTHSSEGLTYGPEGPEITQVWSVASTHEPAGLRALYAGVEPAGLFQSEDGGATWRHVAGLREHLSRPDWQPTSGPDLPDVGGVCLNTICPHPSDPRQMWVGISSGGVFQTRDGGRTWDSCGSTPRPSMHALAITEARGGDDGVRLYQQNHDGVYRSDDGGGRWLDISNGLPSRFEFSLAVHPRNPEKLFVVPLESDQSGNRIVPGGMMAVWRSRDGGAHWQALSSGLPRERTSFSVLRGALALDQSDPVGVYVGTTTGQIYWSVDEGETWKAMPARLPPVYSLAAMTVI